MNALKSVARTQRVNHCYRDSYRESKITQLYQRLKYNMCDLTFSLPYMTEISVVIRQ